MIVGVPREIKPGEQRVALTPAGARALGEAGHASHRARRRQRQQHPGRGVHAEGAVTASVDEVWAQAELILKVKEPIAEEYPRMRAGQVLFTYLHLAAVPELARALQAADVDRHRLRDRAAPRRQPAAAGADERGGRPPRRAGGRVLPRPRRTAAAASCSPACRACRPATWPCSAPGVVGVNAARIAARARRGRLDPRREPRPPARGGRPLPRPRHHADVQQLQRRPGAAPRRPLRGRGAGDGRPRPGARHQGDGGDHEGGLGDRGRGGGPGRQRGDDPPHDAARSRPTSSPASSTTAWPTCRPWSRAPPRSR